ncbi:MAG: acetolactate synthase [Phycisphaerae bacterium]|nr:acetolactate synthase [Phycisphaerae bacterium]
MDTEPFETAEASGVPLVRQFSVFMENRVGSLLRMTRVFENTELHILAISVVDSVDCSVVRMIVDDPDKAYDVLTEAGFSVCESELVVVSLPHGKRALLEVLVALLRGEINVHYTYPLLVRPLDRPALAISTDSLDAAVAVLKDKKLIVLDHCDITRRF